MSQQLASRSDAHAHHLDPQAHARAASHALPLWLRSDEIEQDSAQ